MRFLITAGPTREPIDPARYISNRSSGKMGYAIAEAALTDGHDVTLISGPASIEPPGNANLIPVSTSDEMFEAVHRHADKCDICVLCAAVADYKPANVSSTKIKKRDAKFSLELIPTRDILDSLGHKQDRQFVLVGFAAETDPRGRKRREKAARKELRHHRRKRCKRRRFGNGSDVNEVIILFRNSEKTKYLGAPKKNIARDLVKIFSNFATKMFDKKNGMIN